MEEVEYEVLNALDDMAVTAGVDELCEELVPLPGMLYWPV